jgi:hypothetical protein
MYVDYFYEKCLLKKKRNALFKLKYVQDTLWIVCIIRYPCIIFLCMQYAGMLKSWYVY